MEYLDIIKEALLYLWSIPEVKFMVSHIVLNVVAAVAAAVHTGEFALGKLGEFMYRKVLPYVALYGVARLFGEGAGLDWLAAAVFALIEAALTGDLVENLQKLGVAIPDGVVKFLKA